MLPSGLLGSTTSAPELALHFTVLIETDLPSDVKPDLLEELVRFALAAEDASGSWELTVALVDDGRLRSLHDRFLGIDTETDVMTFPLGDANGGDVVVSVDRAVEQAAEVGHDAHHEVQYLVLHGLLHLLGWNDASSEERAAMLQRQDYLVTAFDRTLTP